MPLNNTKNPTPVASDVVNMDSTGGWLADVLSPGLWGGERAGRAQAMAAAADEDTTFNVRHPATSNLGYALAGGGLGALTGAALVRPFSHDAGALTHGALGGAGLGALAGSVMAGLSRRDDMRQINAAYDAAVQAGTLSPKTPRLSWISALLAPARGPHRTGQVEATEAMRGGKSIAQSRKGYRDALYGTSTLLGGLPIGVAAQLGHSYGQNLKTQSKSRKMQEEEDQKLPATETEKEAAFAARLGRAACRQQRLASSCCAPAG